VAKAEEKMNILRNRFAFVWYVWIVVSAVVLGSKDIGCDGGPVKTPALDRLAANGVRFTDFHSGAPVCSPARATLLTGRHDIRTGVYTVIQDHIHNMHLRKDEVTNRLKKQVLAINASVLKEASDWGPYESLSLVSAKQKPNPETSLKDADLEKLLTRIEATDLPTGYNAATHQTYVDNRFAALTPEQRGRIGTLWKEKRRVHPNMSNAGMSFVKILEYVATGEKLKMKSEAGLAASGKHHLFILSGQSNMAGLDPNVSFTPAVQEEFGKDNVIVVKLAQGGQPIRRWYKNWKSANGTPSKNNGDLYDRLMQLVKKAVDDKKIATVTFVWMQGERDAKTKEFSVYGDSLKGLVKQLQGDLKRKDINVVIGKLGKGQLENKPWSKDWASLRKVQEDLCKADSRWEIVYCDDL